MKARTTTQDRNTTPRLARTLINTEGKEGRDGERPGAYCGGPRSTSGQGFAWEALKGGKHGNSRKRR